MTVALAFARSWSSTSSWSASAVISGTSPLRTSTVVSGSSPPGPAARTASPVPRGSRCTASSTPSGSTGSSARSAAPTTMTLSAPARCAARTGQRIMGSPQIGCSIFGVSERMRVPWPAARMTATGPGMGAAW